jgi:hypothetical protein
MADARVSWSRAAGLIAATAAVFVAAIWSTSFVVSLRFA